VTNDLLTRRQIVWTAILAVVGAGLCFAPLFDLLGYEFSAAIGTVGGIASGVLAVGVVRRAREVRGVTGVGVLFGRAMASGILVLVLPLVLSALNALRVKNCDLLEGLAFYVVIPCVSVTYGTSAGTLFGLATRTSRRGTLVWVAWLFGSVALVVFNLVREPPKFAYHALLGFVPGPLYEEEVTVTGTLLVSRGMALLTSATFLSAAWATLDAANGRLAFRWSVLRDRNRRVPVVLTLIAVVVLGVVWANAGVLGIRPTRRDIRRVLDGRVDTNHFTIYYELSAVPTAEVRLFADDAEFRYGQLVRFFGFELSRKVGVYLFTSPEQKKRWIGAADTSLADPVNAEIHLNRREFPHPVLKHELAHVFAGEFHRWMKVSPAIGLLEGVAVAADWNEGRLTAHQWSRAMQRLGLSPKMTRIMSPFGFWRESSSRAYTASGSFCRWLVKAYGTERLARVYPTGNFAHVYGKSLGALNDEWEAFLRTVPLSPADLREAKRRFQRKSVFQKTCAHVIANLEEEARRRYAVRDFAGARSFYERILSFEPDNADARWRVVQTHIASGDWLLVRDKAQALAVDNSAGDLIRLLAQEAVADANARIGALERARNGFEGVRRADYSPEVNRRVTIKRDALRRNPTARRLVHAYFDEPRAEARLYRLRELTLSEPDWSLAYYLLGRALSDAEQWSDAVRVLAQAERLGLPDRNFGAESARLRGYAYYRLGRYNAAKKAFADAASLVDREGDRLNLADWRERCVWALERRRRGESRFGANRLGQRIGDASTHARSDGLSVE
jgi:tetratricopeptide (TPR) repeat protein